MYTTLASVAVLLLHSFAFVVPGCNSTDVTQISGRCREEEEEDCFCKKSEMERKRGSTLKAASAVGVFQQSVRLSKKNNWDSLITGCSTEPNRPSPSRVSTCCSASIVHRRKNLAICCRLRGTRLLVPPTQNMTLALVAWICAATLCQYGCWTKSCFLFARR